MKRQRRKAQEAAMQMGEAERERKRRDNRARMDLRMQEAAIQVERIQEEYHRMQRRRMADEWVWCEFQGWREGRDELRRGITRHAFNMVDFMVLTKDFQNRLYLSESIFCCPETRLEVFYKNKSTRAKRVMHLVGFRGASWFDYQIQLTRFFPKVARIIEITVVHDDSKMVVVFLPRVFVQKRARIYKCPLITVYTKTGEYVINDMAGFYPSTYNPRIINPNDDEYLF